ncbi:MAG: hypothetical protein PHV74_13065 [Dehalococcoidia bacterium]|nr:hypothetical protein [Dehalococcoidia bacterium]
MADRVLADRLMDLCEKHAHKIADQWYKSLSTNERTPSFAALSKEACVHHAVLFYKNLERMYFSKNPYDEVAHVLDIAGFAEYVHAKGVPLSEAIYALVLIRRHIWLYAESQALFTSPEDTYQALQSTNRVLLLSDFAVHFVAKRYEEMS